MPSFSRHFWPCLDELLGSVNIRKKITYGELADKLGLKLARQEWNTVLDLIAGKMKRELGNDYDLTWNIVYANGPAKGLGRYFSNSNKTPGSEELDPKDRNQVAEYERMLEAGIKSKRRIRSNGTEYGGQKLSRGALYLMLQNRIYRGEITHKGNAFPGEHPVIVEQSLWDDVQAVLAKNRIERATGTRAKSPSLLAGLVFDEASERLTPTYAVKKGTRYRYYISTTLLTGAGRNRSSGRRIPAGDLEGRVINRLRAFLADPAVVLDAVDDESHGGSGQSQLIERGRQVAEELGAQAPNEVKTTLMTLLCRVEINPDRIEIHISRHRLASLLTGQSIDPTMQDDKLDRDSDDVMTLTAPARLKRVGREMRMLVENSDDQTAADPSLLRIIARAHDIQERLIRNTEMTVHDIAREERVSAAYI